MHWLYLHQRNRHYQLKTSLLPPYCKAIYCILNTYFHIVIVMYTKQNLYSFSVHLSCGVNALVYVEINRLFLPCGGAYTYIFISAHFVLICNLSIFHSATPPSFLHLRALYDVYVQMFVIRVTLKQTGFFL